MNPEQIYGQFVQDNQAEIDKQEQMLGILSGKLDIVIDYGKNIGSTLNKHSVIIADMDTSIDEKKSVIVRAIRKQEQLLKPRCYPYYNFIMVFLIIIMVFLIIFT